MLLVEDDELDATMVKEAITKAGLDVAVDCVSDGQQALAYLQDRAVQRPSLIILDLDLPRMDGLELLKTIRSSPDLAWIPVVILSGSEDPAMVEEGFKDGVAGYFLKPLDWERFMQSVKAILQYWQMNYLPGDRWEVADAGL